MQPHYTNFQLIFIHSTTKQGSFKFLAHIFDNFMNAGAIGEVKGILRINGGDRISRDVAFTRQRHSFRLSPTFTLHAFMVEFASVTLSSPCYWGIIRSLCYHFPILTMREDRYATPDGDFGPHLRTKSRVR